MYGLSENPQQQQLQPQPIDFYKDDIESQHSQTNNSPPSCSNMMLMEVSPPVAALPPPHNHPMILGDSSGADDDTPKAPKKRAETWVQEETRALINFRREIDCFFNTSKSNKHLWEQISAKMREKGFERSASMCTDKWRNLLKEFKKSKHHSSTTHSKMSYYKEIEEIIRERNNKSTSNYFNTPSPKVVDTFMQFSDKGTEDTGTFGPVEANGSVPINLERQVDHDGHPLAVTAADDVAASGVSPWDWRGTAENVGVQRNPYDARVIAVKFGDCTRRIGINGSADAIKEAIKCAFRLRSKRAFCLEDENNVVHPLDRDMPLGNYVLHVDEGLTVKVCLYEESDHPVHTEDMTFYTEDEFRQYLSRRGWRCLREYKGFKIANIMDELCPGAMYRGVN